MFILSVHTAIHFAHETEQKEVTRNSVFILSVHTSVHFAHETLNRKK